MAVRHAEPAPARSGFFDIDLLDVLAFAMQEGPPGSPDTGLLGDVVISIPTATRQARERDRPIIANIGAPSGDVTVPAHPTTTISPAGWTTSGS